MEAGNQIAAAVRDARARILWGDPPDEVLESMREAGIEEAYAEQVVAAARGERAAEARAQGIKHMIIGGAIMVALALPMIGMLMAQFISMALIAGCFAGVAYGLIRVVKGLNLFLAGPDFRGAISDLYDS